MDDLSILQLPHYLTSGWQSHHSIYIVVILILITMSAMISGAEAAFFSLTPSEKDLIKQSENKNHKTVEDLLGRPQELLATILITNNFVNVGLVILSSNLVGELFVHSLSSEWIQLLVEVVGITLLLLLFGEVIPKIYATKNALAFSTFISGSLHLLNQAPPVSWIKDLLVHGSSIIQRRARRKGIKISSDELEQALALTKEESTSSEEHKILEGIVKFGNTEVCQIMKSRLNVVAISRQSNMAEVMDTILESGYSRIPVFEAKFDNVIGILFIKDILPYLNKDYSQLDWLQLIRKPYFVPENKKIDDLLKEFQVRKVHMAVVVDEYGGASGICTLEDILEEIVGDITDEFDDDEIVFTRIDEDTFLFEGRTSLVDMYKVLEVDGKDFESRKGDADTVGGFMVENAGRILRNNEYIDVENLRLVVESSDKRRVKMVKVIRQQTEESKEE